MNIKYSKAEDILPNNLNQKGGVLLTSGNTYIIR